MKKYTLLSLLAVGVLLFAGATPASAACFTFPDFCDQIEVSQSGNLLFGLWDWECTGNLTSIIGANTTKFSLVTRPTFSDGSSFSHTEQFVFNKATDTVDFYITDDGVTLTQTAFGVPYTKSAGSCGFVTSGPDNPKPSMSLWRDK